LSQLFRDAEISASGEVGRFRVVASSPELQRDGFAIPLEAWDLAAHRANPVLLFNHDRHSLESVIGRAEVFTTDQALEAEIEFTAPGLNPFADQVRRMWEAGYLRAVSVGAAIHRAEKDGAGMRVLEAELLDLSVVSVGADPSAVSAVARAFDFPDDVVGRFFTPFQEPEPTPQLDRPRLSAAELRARLLAASRGTHP